MRSARLRVATATLALVAGCGGDDGGGGPSNDAGTNSEGGSGSDTGNAGPAPTPAPGCNAFAPGNDVSLCTATYLGGPGADTIADVAFAPDGSLVVGGSIDGNEFGKTPVALKSGRAVVLRLSSDGRSVLSITRVGAALERLAVDPMSGAIVVAVDSTLMALDSEAKSIKWTVKLSAPAKKLSIAKDGMVAALVSKSVKVVDSSGTPLGEVSVAGTTVNDVAIDSGNKLVYAAGFTQDDGAPCTQLQSPFFRAYRYDGTLAWKNYDWSRTAAGATSDCADSRGISVAMGLDGKLYYAGEQHGGNTVHRKDPRDLAVNAPIVKFDKYNDSYNMNGAAAFTFYGRYDAATGALESGQFLVTRIDSSGKGNTIRPSAIAADAKGNVILSGSSACCIEDGPLRTVNGVPAMPGYAGGAFLFVAQSDFKKRLAWTTFHGANGGGVAPSSLSVNGTTVAATFLQAFKDKDTTASPMITVDAIGPVPPGGAADGYLVVLRAP